MQHYSPLGQKIIKFDQPSIPPFQRLPTGTYVLKFNPDLGFYFEIIDDFELPKKTYGDLSPNRDRIISTFLDRPAATGVVLAGEKGSGKTLLAKSISVELLKQEIPTIVINSQFAGDAFATVIQRIEQPACIFFDEFEKCYDKEHQEALLTLMDGVYPTKKLFMLTTNDKYRVDKHMQNRPGRVFYMLNFAGLDPSFMREYIDENVVNPDHRDSAFTTACMFNSMNFDMLKALVEEMNRYNETAQDAMKMLNVSAEFDGSATYKAELFIKDEEIPIWRLQNNQWTGNPLNGDIAVSFLSFEQANGVETLDQYDDDVQHAEGRWSGYLLTEEREKQAEWIKEKRGAKNQHHQWVSALFSPEDIARADPKSLTFETETTKLVLHKLYSSKSSSSYDY